MHTPEFALLTARLLGERNVFLAGARRNGKLTAALPVTRRGRTLFALRSEHTPRVDFIGEAESIPALWRALRQAGPWDVLEFRGVPADSPLARFLPPLARDDRCKVHVRETSRAPWFLVDGIEQRIHRRFRGDMRRLERQAGGVELERVSRFDREAVTSFLRLEAAAWKADAGTAIGCDHKLVHFYRALARIFAPRGALSIAFLRARGVRIAAQFALEDASTLYLMKVGYDPAYAHFGPGQLLVRETAADAARRGLERYDLLGKDTPWKLKWTDLSRGHVEIRIYAPSLRARARHFAREVARPVVGRALRSLKLNGSRIARVSRATVPMVLLLACSSSEPPPTEMAPTAKTLLLPVDASGDAEGITNDAPDASKWLDASEELEAGDEAPEAGEDAATGPLACGLSPCATGMPCADLIVDRDDLLASIVIDTRTFQPTDCALAEGCIAASGTRRLLRFDTAAANVGTADLVIGDTSTNACFMYSQCHMHYHFRGVGRYTLYQSDGQTIAAVGHKQGFCVDDTRPYPSLNPPPPQPSVPYDCNVQGLHVGYEDLYPNDIDCQWIDITGVPPGAYILSVKINEGRYLPESNYDNNEERVPVSIN